MKVAIAYYSFTGNTKKAVGVIAEILKAQNNSVQLLEIQAPKGSANFFIQCLRAVVRKKVEILPIETDLSAYDLVILGCPIWAREMVPAMRQFLEKASGINGKRAAVFVTYGSGFGKEHCLASMERALKQKGASEVSRFSLSQFKVGDRELIEKLLRACPPSALHNADQGRALKD